MSLLDTHPWVINIGMILFFIVWCFVMSGGLGWGKKSDPSNPYKFARQPYINSSNHHMFYGHLDDGPWCCLDHYNQAARDNEFH